MAGPFEFNKDVVLQVNETGNSDCFTQSGPFLNVSQLKPINSIIPLKDKILFKKPSNFSKPLAKIKKGRVLIVQKCKDNWCKIKTGKFKGWIEINDVWGQVN